VYTNGPLAELTFPTEKPSRLEPVGFRDHEAMRAHLISSWWSHPNVLPATAIEPIGRDRLRSGW
jgi:hypothetical protein